MSDEISRSAPEIATLATPRDVAREFGEYFSSYSFDRFDVDKPSDRISGRNELVAQFPGFERRIVSLDETFETAQYYLDPAKPKSQSSGFLTDGDVLEQRPRPVLGSPIPPDYTFSSVRNPVTRRILNLINIAGVSEEVLDDVSRRPDALKENGEKIVKTLSGDNDTSRLIRIKLSDVLTAVFDGRLTLSYSPSEPIAEDKSIVHQDLTGDLNGVDY